jgi:hypothetical protein
MVVRRVLTALLALKPDRTFLMLSLHIRKPHAETSRKLVQGQRESLCPVQVDHSYSGRSSVHQQSPGATYPFWLGSDEAGS